MPHSTRVLLPAAFIASTACQSPIPEPKPEPRTTPLTVASAEASQPKKDVKLAARPVAKVKASPDDPKKGKFTLADATKDLAGSGKLYADLDTDKGRITCELYKDRAPLTVANFVGLARGLRPYKKEGEWVTERAYDGLTFHRIIKGFMIQGGDWKGTGTGTPGYKIPDEIWENGVFDRAGLLAMANAGANTNGMQFFITHGKAPHLNGRHTIFGECKPMKVIDELANVPVKGDRPATAPKMEKVTIRYENAAGAPAGSGSAGTTAAAPKAGAADASGPAKGSAPKPAAAPKPVGSPPPATSAH